MVKNSVTQMVADTNNRQAYTLVVGLGLTGMSVVRFLHARGERVVVVDTRDVPPGCDELKMNHPDVELKTGVFDEQIFSKAKQIIISPGVPLSIPEIQAAVTNKVDVIGEKYGNHTGWRNGSQSRY